MGIISGGNVHYSELENKYPEASLVLRAMLVYVFVLLILTLLKAAILIASGGGVHFERLFYTFRTLVSISHMHDEIEYAFSLLAVFLIAINYSPLSLKRLIRYSFGAIAFVFVVYRSLNLLHIYFEGGHISSEVISHIDMTSIGMAFDPSVAMVLLLASSVAYVSSRAISLLDFSQTSIKKRIVLVLVILLISLVVIKTLRLDRESMAMRAMRSEIYSKYPPVAFLPEQELINSYSASGNAPAVKSISIMPESTRELLKGFGFYMDSANINALLGREKVFFEKLPYAITDNRAEIRNVIIIYLESFSSYFINYYGNSLKGLTPNIDAFAAEATVVAPHFNSSTPTISGLVGIMCSHTPVFGHEYWMNVKNKFSSDLLCAPEVFKQYGYTSYIVKHGDPYFAGMKPFMEANGVDHVYGMMKIEQDTGLKPKGEVFGGYSDKQTMSYIRQLLNEDKLDEPFMLLTSTADLHPPFHLPKDVELFESGDNAILNLVHTSDKAFGIFWDYFKTSKYKDNTILVVTADHPILPGTMYKSLRGGDASYYDEIPLMIYDPFHKLPEKINIESSSVDILPSILHLLDINTINPFEGHTVFGEMGRKAYPNLLGSHSYLMHYRTNGKSNSFIRLQKDCVDEADIFDKCDYSNWWRHKKWLVENDLIWN
jgi:phosphoglycerol transferase MdoB-like AlkP superfamily enzyme